MERIEIAAPGDVGHIRRSAQAAARAAGLNDAVQGRVALAVTEAATNLVKHAGGGEILIGRSNHGHAVLEVLALDRGPGLRDLDRAMRDGESSTGTSGTGLGAMSRQADEFDIHSTPGMGTAIYLRFGPPASARPAREFTLGGVSVPVRGETVCGDAWYAWSDNGSLKIMVSDGLGHGPDANEASRAAIETCERGTGRAPAELLGLVHDGLRHTRGAAALVTEIARGSGVVRCCGVGNLSGCVLGGPADRHLVSLHGTLGHEVRRLQEFQYGWNRDSVLVITTDGIQSHWDLSRYPGLARRHPTLVAGVLYRDFRRERDDATVVVAREAA